MDAQWGDWSRDIQGSWCQIPVARNHGYSHTEPADPCGSSAEHFAIHGTRRAWGTYYPCVQPRSQDADGNSSPDCGSISHQVSPFQAPYPMGSSGHDIFGPSYPVTNATNEHTLPYRAWADAETTSSIPSTGSTMSFEESYEPRSRPSSRSRPPKTEESVRRRRAQNRKAQRAFRQRKERFVQTLQRQIEEMRAQMAEESAKNQELDGLVRSLESMLRDPGIDGRDCKPQRAEEWSIGT